MTGPEAGPTLHVTRGIDMGGNIAPVAWRYPGGEAMGEVWGRGEEYRCYTRRLGVVVWDIITMVWGGCIKKIL